MLSPGQHKIGPSNGRLVLRTFREGMAAMVGHDLVIDITRWQGTVTIPDGAGGQPSLSAEIDLASLEVREGVGGVKPLSDSDRDEIKGNIAETLKTSDNRKAAFQSKTVQLQGNNATVDGEFTLAGATHPLRITVEENGGRTVVGKAIVQQTTWGIKPYKAFLGALKVRDTVEIEATVTLT